MANARTALIVDPDPEAQHLVASTVREMGLDPRTASGADQALAAVREQPPSLVLLELDLPGPSGFEVLERLREQRAGLELPILVITSRQGEQELTRAFELGADEFLRKPLNRVALRARLGAHMRLRQSAEELARKQQDAQVMLELTQALASSLDFHDILHTVVRRLAEVVQVARASLVLVPEGQHDDTGHVVAASDDEQLTNLAIDLTTYPEIQRVLKTGEALTVANASTHPLLEGVRPDVQFTPLSSLNLFPIVWEGQTTGVLFLRARPERGSLSEHESHVCQIVANATATALRNARVMQSLREHTQEVTSARAEAERRLHSLKQYADLFASAAEGIAVIDVHGKLLFANPRCHELLGYPEHELAGLTIEELVQPDDLDVADTIWHGIRNGRLSRDVDVRIRRKDGEPIVCNCSFSSLMEGEGAVLFSFRDVTEERRIESELKKTKEFLESLIDASVDGIVAADMRGNIILFNRGAEYIYGHRAKDVVGKMNVQDLYPGDGARRVMNMLRSERYGGAGWLQAVRFDVLNDKGEHVPIQLSAAIIYEDGTPTATFGIFTDLREKLRVEERLAETKQKLAATEKQALLAELAGTTAHELNQPLTSVMGYAQLLLRKLPEGSTEYRAAEMMLKETERMADIVRKIGRMTRYETKSYVGEQRILDLEKASDPADPATKNEG